MSVLREAAQQALEALEEFGTHYGHCPRYPTWARPELQPPCNCGLDSNVAALRAALAQQEQEPEPVAWTDRELQLIDGMIEVQLHHAAQCDGIANRTMAEKQKGWDMERVALLQKIKSNPPRREPELLDALKHAHTWLQGSEPGRAQYLGEVIAKAEGEQK